MHFVNNPGEHFCKRRAFSSPVVVGASLRSPFRPFGAMPFWRRGATLWYSVCTAALVMPPFFSLSTKRSPFQFLTRPSDFARLTSRRALSITASRKRTSKASGTNTKRQRMKRNEDDASSRSIVTRRQGEGRPHGRQERHRQRTVAPQRKMTEERRERKMAGTSCLIAGNNANRPTSMTAPGP